MNDEYLVHFVESFRTDDNSALIDTIHEGYITMHEARLEGIGDNIRNTVNRVKTAASVGKEVLFGSDAEQSFKNNVAKSILNSGMYNADSIMGKASIKKILKLIVNGTNSPTLPTEIAGIADDVLVSVMEDALQHNSKIHPVFKDKFALRKAMDAISNEIANSVIKPLAKLGKTRLNDDRQAIVSDWWNSNVVPKMGKYYKVFMAAPLEFASVAPVVPPPAPEKAPTVRKPRKKAVQLPDTMNQI